VPAGPRHPEAECISELAECANLALSAADIVNTTEVHEARTCSSCLALLLPLACRVAAD
jgi:hypothetical protein